MVAIAKLKHRAALHHPEHFHHDRDIPPSRPPSMGKPLVKELSSQGSMTAFYPYKSTSTLVNGGDNTTNVPSNENLNPDIQINIDEAQDENEEQQEEEKELNDEDNGANEAMGSPSGATLTKLKTGDENSPTKDGNMSRKSSRIVHQVEHYHELDHLHDHEDEPADGIKKHFHSDVVQVLPMNDKFGLGLFVRLKSLDENHYYRKMSTKHLPEDQQQDMQRKTSQKSQPQTPQSQSRKPSQLPPATPQTPIAPQTPKSPQSQPQSQPQSPQQPKTD